MAGVLVSASTGVMNSVIGKLATLMGEEYKKHKSMQRDVTFLKDELASMNAVLSKLADMEEEHDLQTKEWRNQVMDMAFDIEDCVDEFIHHGGGDDADLGFVRKTTRRLKKLRARRQIANQMQELKARVKDVSERRQRYNLDECASSSRYVAVDHRMPALYIETANLVGMDGPKGELMKLLALEEEGVSIQCLRVVSIFGFGGLGKTALANSVYHQLRGQYDCKVFVSVSQRPDLMKLLSRIVSKVGMPQGAHIYEVQDLIDNLREHLKDKRYLFVIDDIWNESVWEILQCAFPDNQQGSKVMTTTRIETVAKVCCNYHQEYIYKMKPLDNQNSQKLFFRRLGHVSSQPFKEVSDEILQKCGGLPLAILSIASLLASQSTGSIEQWKYVCSSLSSNLRTHPSSEGMRQILNLSYNHLPLHLKPCLLYIGMYPEDYSIVKKDLLRQWVAEGFVFKMQDRDAEEVAESYFNELINRSMIQPLEAAKYNGEILKCKVHDLILDLIVFKSEEDNFLRVVDNQHSMNITLQCKVRRLSLHLDDTNQNMTLGKSLSHLRSLAVFGKANVLLPVSEFKTIRVLHLEFSLGSSGDRFDLTPVCKSVHLRYLKIPDFVQMPTRMGALQCLETLELERSSGCINGIPSDIINLPHLLHLIVPSSTRLPDGIGNVKRLRTLRPFNLGVNSVDNLKGLGELTNLRDLELCGCRDGMIRHQRHMDILWSSIGKLVNCSLRRLDVARVLLRPFPSIPADELGSLTVYHSHLERLKAIPWLFPRFPMWTGQLRKLGLLHIGVRRLMKEDIDVLAGLPALADLWMWTKKGPKENIIIRCTAFPVLKFIRFSCSEVCLTVEAGAMPKLHTLELGFHAQGVDLYGRTLDGVEYLPILKYAIACIYCGGANESFRMGAEAAFRNAIDMHPSRPSIIIMNADGQDCGMREVCRDDSDDNDNSMEIDSLSLSSPHVELRRPPSIPQRGSASRRS